MKRVLITGANSYIGTSFNNWIINNVEDIQTETIDMIDDSWKNADFTGYDSIFHVAGLAHADIGNVSDAQKDMYYKVNTYLTIQCAEKAKKSGVHQFLFMSSMIVYGESTPINIQKVITRETPLAPSNFYGDSKVKAEEGILSLEDENFHIVIIRAPMIYGENAKGNYGLLSKIAKRMPVFPLVQNARSMLYIGNLCKFLSLLILNEEKGIFFPQNEEYVNTSDMVKEIALLNHKKLILIKLFTPALFILCKTQGKIGRMINKAFGNSVYAKDISKYKYEYQIYDFKESIRLTEGLE